MGSNDLIITMRFASKPDELKHVREKIRKTLSEQNLPSSFIDSLVLAVDEASANIIQHAYKGDCTGEIILEIFQNPSEIIVRLTDFAEPIDSSTCKPRPLKKIRPGGLGIYFMNELMDDVQFLKKKNRTGNILQMKKNKHEQ